MAKQNSPSPSPLSPSTLSKGDQDRVAELVALKLQSVLAARVETTSETFVGPLPHPDTLKQYGEINPELPKDIVGMAKAEQSARHSNARQIMRFRLVGLTLAFILAMVLIGVATFLIYHDKNAWATGTLITAGAGIIGVAIYGHRASRKPAEPSS